MPDELTFEEVSQMAGRVTAKNAARMLAVLDKLPPNQAVKTYKAIVLTQMQPPSNESLAITLHVYRWAEARGIDVRSDDGELFSGIWQQLSNLTMGSLSQDIESAINLGQELKKAVEDVITRNVLDLFDTMELPLEGNDGHMVSKVTRMTMESVFGQLGINL